MRFEHLIQINDPLMPLLDPLTRAQLWRGIVMRVSDPVHFLEGLRTCTIDDRSKNGSITSFARTLNFGAFNVNDRVTLTPMEQIVVDAPASEQFPASRLTISIEQPGDLLFLRFIYESDDAVDDSELDSMTLAMRRQAYASSDIDTVKRIRALAADGRLD